MREEELKQKTLEEVTIETLAMDKPSFQIVALRDYLADSIDEGIEFSYERVQESLHILLQAVRTWERVHGHE